MLRICRVDEEGKEGKLMPVKGGSYAIARRMLETITKDEERREIKLVSDTNGVLFRLVNVGDRIEAQTPARKFVALLGQASRARRLEQQIKMLGELPEVEK